MVPKQVTLRFRNSDKTPAHNAYSQYFKTLVKQYAKFLVGTHPHSATLTWITLVFAISACLEKLRGTKTFSACWTGVEVAWWKEFVLGFPFVLRQGFLKHRLPSNSLYSWEWPGTFNLSASVTQVLELQMCGSGPTFYRAEYLVQDLLHARQLFHQTSYTSSHRQSFHMQSL